MSQENPTNSQEDNNDVIPPSATAEYVDEPPIEPIKRDSQTNNCGEENKKPVKVIIENIAQNDRPKYTANTIGWIAIGINALLAYYTYLLFNKTREANQTAKDALKQTVIANDMTAKSLEDARKQRVEDRAREIVNDSINFKKDSLNNDLIKKSINAQIASIKETQRQFEIGNEPYLQSEMPIFTSGFEVGQPTEVEYQIQNLGNYPVKILKMGLVVATKVVPPDFSEVYASNPIGGMQNYYVINGIPNSPYRSNTTALTENQVANVKSGKWFVYTIGFVKYQNLVTKKIREYRFMTKSDIFNQVHSFIINDNVDVSK